jgi:hypothetical protein
MLVCVFFAQFCTRDRGCSAHPAFPAPSDFKARKFMQTSGASRRENAKSCAVISPPSTRSCAWRGGVGGGGSISLLLWQRVCCGTPPPPTPKSELRSSRPHRFAGGREEMFAMAGCLKIEFQLSSPGIAVRRTASLPLAYDRAIQYSREE